MNIHIRPAVEADFPEIIALFHEFALFEKLPEKMTNSVAQMQLEKEFFHAFVALSPDGRLAGYVTYSFGYYTWIGKSLYMDDLYVRPSFRGQGIGKQLMQEVITLGKSEGCRKLRWQVSQWNEPAIAFYKKAGAQIDNTEQNCDLLL